MPETTTRHTWPRALLLVLVWLAATSPRVAAREATPSRFPVRDGDALAIVAPEITQPGAHILAADETPAAHLWLARPFAPGQQQTPAYSYPYGSTGGGRYVLHTGIDISNPLATPVLAVADGEVVYAGNDGTRTFGPKLGFYGNLVVVRLAQELDEMPVYVLHGHLNEVRVATGRKVSAGDVIGTVGMTGIAIGPHLHLEVRAGQSDRWHTLNPEFWLAPLPGAGTVAGRVLTLDGLPVSDVSVHLYTGDGLSRVGVTYPAEDTINPDPGFQENFVLSDVPAGAARLVVRDGKRNVSLPIQVQPGGLTFVEFRVAGQ